MQVTQKLAKQCLLEKFN